MILATMASDGISLSFAILAVMSAAWLAGWLARVLGYPAMLGELLAGILLGPPLLGWLPEHVGLTQLADVGIFVMMLYIGTEIDPKEMSRASKPAILAAVGGFVVPFLLGFAVTWLYLQSNLDPEAADYSWSCIAGGLFVGMAVGVTSLAAKSRILLDLKLLDSRIAIVMMAGALFADTASLVVFAGIMGFAESQSFDVLHLVLILGQALLFFAASVGIGVWVFPLVPKLLRKLKLQSRSIVFTTVLILAFAVGELAHLMSLHGIIGAFMAGLFLKNCTSSSREAQEVSHLLHDVSMGFLAPIFFVTAGFAFSFDAITTDLPLLVTVVAVAIGGKILGTVLFYLPSGHGWREGLAIGCGMNGRGAVEIIVAGIGLEMGLISPSIFSILVFMAIFTTALVPVTLKWTTAWLERRGELERVAQRSGVLVLGVGPVARQLARRLKTSQEVRMVGDNQSYCSLAQQEGIEAFYGHLLDAEVLTLAQAFKVRTAVVLTPDFETNLLAAGYLQENYFIPEIRVHLSGKDAASYKQLLDTSRYQSLFGGQIELNDWDRWVALDRFNHELIELDSPRSIEQLRERISIQTCLPLLQERGDQLLVYHAATALEPGDKVHMLVPHSDDIIELDRFDELIAEAHILDLEEGCSLETLFAVIAEHFAPELKMSRAEIIASYKRRESQGGTVFGKGLAIPHILLEHGSESHIMVVRCKPGVVFSENHNVHAVFALASSADQRNLHLRILSAIAQIAQTATFQTEWIEAQHIEQLRKLLLSARRRRF